MSNVTAALLLAEMERTCTEGPVFGRVRELQPATCDEYPRDPFHPDRFWGGGCVYRCCRYLDLDQGEAEKRVDGCDRAENRFLVRA
jgi:hypothetical protein